MKLFQSSFDQTDSVEATVKVKERTQLFQQVVSSKYLAKLILETFHKHNQ